VQPEATFDVNNPDCNPAEDEECARRIEEAINAPDPEHPIVSPEQKEKAREILLADPTVQQFLAGREAGRDYWLRFNAPGLAEDRSAAKQGFILVSATFYFDPPLQYSGPVPEKTEPCEGHGYEGYVKEDDPCREVTVEYGTKDVAWKEVYTVFVTVQLGLGKVVSLRDAGSVPQMWPDFLRPKELEQ
jgi:hypothetical protein